MHDYPLVSVITPSFNQDQFIEETICSVLDLSYPNIQYIIIDGGSTDKSVEIIKKYQHHISYWESKPDKGQAEAINKGFSHAKGKYVGWINSDDLLASSAIKYAVEAFQENQDCGTVYGTIQVVDKCGNNKYLRRNKRPVTKEGLLNGGVEVIQPGSLHRMNLLKKYGFLDENLHYALDYELWIRLSKYSMFCGIDKIVAYFREYDQNKTGSNYIRFIPEIADVRRKYGGKLICKRSFNMLRVVIGYWRRKYLKF